MVRLGLEWRSHDDAEVPDLAGVDALIVHSGRRVDAAVLSGFEGSLVLTTTSGFDHIDLDAAERRGAVVGRTPMARRDAVVSHALSTLIYLMREMPRLQVEARKGRWARGDLPALGPVGLHGATVAVVGLGVIGTAMARALATLGARVLGVDPAGVPAGVKAVSLPDALRGCDAVTLHCALTPQTRDLLSAERLGWLRPGAVVVNTARGPVLDVEAAVAMVADGRLRGLASDVFPVEPYPEIAAGASTTGVIFTPHSAGYTTDLGRRVVDGVVETLTAWSEGRPIPHPVRRGVG